MVKKSILVQYVNDNLSYELNAVKASPISSIDSALNLEERVLIYKYTEDGYERVNNSLRNSNGKVNSEYGILLKKTLKRLPSYTGLVYRSVDLNSNQLAIYENAVEKNIILVEHCFISTSKSFSIANMYGGKCRFTIICKSGREIEKFSKYGLYSGQNEKEVLFAPNCRFNVLEVNKDNDHTSIIMEEVR